MWIRSFLTRVLSKLVKSTGKAEQEFLVEQVDAAGPSGWVQEISDDEWSSVPDELWRRERQYEISCVTDQMIQMQTERLQLERWEFQQRAEETARHRAQDPPIKEDLIPERKQRRQQARDALVACLMKGWQVVSSLEQIVEMGESLMDLPTTQSTPSLYLDSEGVNLGRGGTMTILTLLVRPAGKLFIIDLNALGPAAFETSFNDGKTTLRKILEDQNIPKCFWDVRNDSDAIYAHFRIHMRGIVDVQLMQCGSSGSGGRRNLVRISAYGKDVVRELNGSMSKDEEHLFEATEDVMKEMFRKPESPEKWELLERRPMTEDVVLYCALDVHYQPQLYDIHRANLTEELYEEVQEYSNTRANECMRSDEERILFAEHERRTTSPWDRDEVARAESEVRNLLRSRQISRLEEEEKVHLAKVVEIRAKIKGLKGEVQADDESVSEASETRSSPDSEAQSTEAPSSTTETTTSARNSVLILCEDEVPGSEHFERMQADGPWFGF